MLSYHCIKITVYVDDGYTGTNFNRPGFQEMLQDIGLGYVNTVIVKDSSRFGRNYIEIVRICRRLYEDNLSGKVADKMFAEMSAQYAEEEELLRSRITESRRQLAEMQEAGNEKDSFLTAIRRFMEMETLTPQILRELIDKIVVHQAEGLGKNRTQHIEIHYRFIGTVDVPAGDEPNVKLDTRRGVAIEYRTQSA